MIEVGDMVVCVETRKPTEWYPGITKGKKYVVNSIIECCGLVGLDVGLNLNKPLGHHPGSYCPKCSKVFTGVDVPYYRDEYFRKIEPEYRAVSVPESITEQAKTLLTPETVAQ